MISLVVISSFVFIGIVVFIVYFVLLKKKKVKENSILLAASLLLAFVGGSFFNVGVDAAESILKYNIAKSNYESIVVKNDKLTFDYEDILRIDLLRDNFGFDKNEAYITENNIKLFFDKSGKAILNPEDLYANNPSQFDRLRKSGTINSFIIKESGTYTEYSLYDDYYDIYLKKVKKLDNYLTKPISLNQYLTNLEELDVRSIVKNNLDLIFDNEIMYVEIAYNPSFTYESIELNKKNELELPIYISLNRVFAKNGSYIYSSDDRHFKYYIN